MNLVQVLFQSFQRWARRPALVFNGQTFPYRELGEEIAKRTLWLQRKGIKKGDRVALLLPKGTEFIFLHFALQSAGAVSLPLNPGYTGEEIHDRLSDSESCLLITDAAGYQKLKTAGGSSGVTKMILIDDSSPGGEEPLQKEMGKMTAGPWPICSVGENDGAIMIHTSGTTGKAKGVLITHRNLVVNLRALQRLWRWTDRDILLHVLPLFHIHGLIVALHGALNAGSTVILQEKFDAQRTWEILAREKCTLFMAVPTIYHRMRKEWDAVKPDLRRMRLFISGSAPLSADLFHNFEEATGWRILERYGMTEAGVIASNPLDPRRRVPGSVGYPVPGVRIRIAGPEARERKAGEVGEVWIQGGNVFPGYWRKPEKTEEAFAGGWFKTGDLGYLDPDDHGRLYLVGRAKELIITGGLNVYPREVEEVLEKHEAVQEAAVIGLPDEEYGEKVAAFVALKKKALPPASGEITAFCRKFLVSYKCPREVRWVERLPRNALGKVEKGALLNFPRN